MSIQMGWYGGPGGLDSPATAAFSVTPNDSTDFAFYTRGLWIGGAGNLSVQMMNDTILTFSGVPAGTLLPLAVRKVRATGTTATNIVGVY
jgi:hypothetical protein